jgi:hypothetical protein
VYLSLGCAGELDYILLLARDLQFLAPRQYNVVERAAREVKLMLAGLIAKISLDSPRKPDAKRASVG